jgi:competence protein ComEC
MKKIIFILFLLIGCLYFCISINSWRRSDYFRVIFLDVGQGDAILIVTPTGQTILVDGGPDAGVLKELGRILPFWLRKIDLVILTHAHDDHLVGLIHVINRYQVKNVLLGAHNSNLALYQTWQNKLTDYNLETIIAKPGLMFNFSNSCELHILASNEKASDENDLSVVSLFNCLGKKVFLGGDASSKIENKIDISRVDIYKASHHGSITSNSESFLSEIKPKLAVISVGLNNKFNHPSELVLKQLLAVGANLFRTDESGSIYFLANNKSILLKK